MPLSGHLELICARGSDGRPVLRHQSFAAPVHLSKPYWEGDTLVANVVNPTAGLFAGDNIRYDITVESGAKLVLASPSANRAHTMPCGEASVQQRFTVADGARLEWWPELFIPQRGTRYRQTTRAKISLGGELLLFEMLAPGRTASGELFEYERLAWDSEITHGDRLVLRERFALEPARTGLAALRARFPEAYYGAGCVFSQKLTQDSACWEAIDRLHCQEASIGFSALASPGRSAAPGWTIRVLAAGSVALRSAMTAIRQEIYRAMGDPAPCLRRT